MICSVRESLSAEAPAFLSCFACTSQGEEMAAGVKIPMIAVLFLAPQCCHKARVCIQTIPPVFLCCDMCMTLCTVILDEGS